MKNRVFSCDIEVNGKKVENKIVKLLLSVIGAIVILAPFILMAFGLFYLFGI